MRSVAVLLALALGQVLADSFRIDYENKEFLLNEKPFRYISGEIHYFRIHPKQWKDRLARVAALGLNAIQVYIPWNFHELSEGQYNFEDARDFVSFLKIAKNLGLYTLLRPGPYICAEWENGGLPWWLLKRPGIKMRTKDTQFASAVERWFNVLMPIVKPLLIQNGGPILMVQVENEYGSFPSADAEYAAWLRDLMQSLLGPDAVLYTTDGGAENYLKNGAIPNVFSTVDFGPGSNAAKAFDVQGKYNKGLGPNVNSEYYSGWLNLWNDSRSTAPSAKETVSTAKDMWALNASFSFYMIHGGTNFGFWAGAEWNAPVTTSYDYGAPINEAGQLTDSYKAIRDWISSLSDWPNKPNLFPANPKITAYGDLGMKRISAITTNIGDRCNVSDSPFSFEDLDLDYGFMLYFTSIPNDAKSLVVPKNSHIKDFGYVLLDYDYQGMLNDYKNEKSLNLNVQNPDTHMMIVVENSGRRTYETINDYKGILGPLEVKTENGSVVSLEKWTSCDVTFGSLPTIETANEAKAKHGFYMAEVMLSSVTDTFFDFSNWGKGVLFVNGFNLGRYWSIGPQLALYVPAPYLKIGKNVIHVLELTETGDELENNQRTLKSINGPLWKFRMGTEYPQQAEAQPLVSASQTLARVFFVFAAFCALNA